MSEKYSVQVKRKYVLISSDYSQQEPRLLATFSRDENMINAYKNKKDLYATIASGVYKMPYNDCLEFYVDENGNKTDKTNPEGKKRRSACKSILLGIMYGRGSASIAEQINSTPQEAQNIIDNFYREFPKVKQWMDDTKLFAKKYGYVETLWGRRRQLPKAMLQEYEFTNVGGKPRNFDPLNFDFNSEELDYSVDGATIHKYLNKLKYARSFYDRNRIYEEANEEGIKIKDNSGYISDAERQSVNTRIQGSAGDMSKLAMLNCWRNKELKEMGFEMLIPVHDEIIGECPVVYAEQCGEILSNIMINAAAEKCDVPFKCDAEYFEQWYGESLSKEDLQKMLTKDNTN